MTSYRQQFADEKRMRKAGWRPGVFGLWTNGTAVLATEVILKRLSDESAKAKALRAEAKQRKAIWENVAGCECSSALPKRDRCNVQVVRCNARLARINSDLKAAGLKP